MRRTSLPLYLLLVICFDFCDGAPLKRSDLLDCSDPDHKFLRCIDGKQYAKNEACLYNNGYYDTLFAAQNFTIWTSNVADPNWTFVRYCDSLPLLPLCNNTYDSTILYLPLDEADYLGSRYTRIGPPVIGGPLPSDDPDNWRLDAPYCVSSYDETSTGKPHMTKDVSRVSSSSAGYTRDLEYEFTRKPGMYADATKMPFKSEAGRHQGTGGGVVAEAPTSIDCSRYSTCPNRTISWREICVYENNLWTAINPDGASLPADLTSSGDWRLLSQCTEPPRLPICHFPEWAARRMYWRYDRVSYHGIQYQANRRHVNIIPGTETSPLRLSTDQTSTWTEEHACVPQNPRTPNNKSSSLRRRAVADLPTIDCLYDGTNYLRCIPKVYPAASTCLALDLLWTTNVTQGWPNSEENGDNWYPAFACENGMPELPLCTTESLWDSTFEYKALDRVSYDHYIWEARPGTKAGHAPAIGGDGWDLVTPCAPTVEPFPTTTTTTPATTIIPTTPSPGGYDIVDCSEYLDWFPWRQFNYKEIVRYYSPDGNWAWEVIWEEGAIRDYPPRPEYGWRLIYQCTEPVIGDCESAQTWNATEWYIPAERVVWNKMLWEATAFLEQSEQPSLDNTSWKSIQQCERTEDIPVPSVVP